MAKFLFAVAISAMLVARFSAPSIAEEFVAPGLGIGNRSCTEWTATRNSNTGESRRYAEWVLGYFSGYNQYGPKGRTFFFRYDESGLVRAVDDLCRNNPNESVMLAVARLLHDISMRPPKTKP